MKYYWLLVVESCQKYEVHQVALEAARRVEREKWEAKITEMNMKGYYRECGWNTCQWRKDK